MKIIYRPLFGILIVLCMPGCDRNETRGSDPPPIELSATVRPAREMTVTARIDGQVETVVLREGSTVAANGEIVILANPTVERDVTLARAQAAWIEGRVRGGSAAPAAPPAPRDNLEITARILELRQQYFEKMRQLRRSNDVTTRELQQAEAEYLAALRDYNNERRAAGSGTPIPGNRNYERELLRLEQQKILAEGRFVTQRESLLRIVSPIAGTVTRVYVAAGQSVFPRDPIADVSDVSTLHVVGEIAPDLLQFVRAGTSVTVRVQSVPPRTFSDEIEYVTPVFGSGPDARSSTVVVTIPNPDGSLQPNTPAVITVRPQP